MQVNTAKLDTLPGGEKEENSVSRYILDFKYEDGSVEFHNLDGIPWNEARIPSRFHLCTPQTRGYTNYFTYVERCACGAIRIGGRKHFWLDINSRRKDQ